MRNPGSAHSGKLHALVIAKSNSQIRPGDSLGLPYKRQLAEAPAQLAIGYSYPTGRCFAGNQTAKLISETTKFRRQTQKWTPPE